MRYFWSWALATLICICASDAFSLDKHDALPQSIRMAFNNFSHELQACHVYNTFAIQCFGDQDESSVAQIKSTASAFNELAINAGKLAGLSEKAILARTEMLSQEMIDDTESNCVNISVLLNKYAKSCKFLMETSTDRIDRMLKGAPR